MRLLVTRILTVQTDEVGDTLADHRLADSPNGRRRVSLPEPSLETAAAKELV